MKQHRSVSKWFLLPRFVTILGLSALFAVNVSCASKSVREPIRETPVIEAVKTFSGGAGDPIGGSWVSGKKLLDASNGKLEADAVFAKGERVILIAAGGWYSMLGLEDIEHIRRIDKDKSITKLSIPGLGDEIRGKDHLAYHESARKFGQDFNLEMLKQLGL